MAISGRLPVVDGGTTVGIAARSAIRRRGGNVDAGHQPDAHCRGAIP